MTAVPIGLSQVGKSSFAKTVTGLTDIAIGTGRGESCTAMVQAYTGIKVIQFLQQKYKFLLMDLPGWQDTRLTSDEEIQDTIEKSIFQATEGESGLTQLDVFLLFESVVEGVQQISQNLKKLTDIYGKDVEKSTLVLLVKKNLIGDEDLAEDKLEGRIDVCDSHGLPYMEWTSNYITTRGRQVDLPQQQLDSQLQELFTKIKQLQPFSCQKLKEMENQVLKRAKELEDVYEKELVEVKHDTRQKIDVQEMSFETKTNTIERTEYVPQYRERRCGFLWLSTRKEICGHKEVKKNVNIDTVVPVPKTVQKLIGDAEAKFMVTKQKPDQTFFLSLAREEIKEENRQWLLQKREEYEKKKQEAADQMN